MSEKQNLRQIIRICQRKKTCGSLALTLVVIGVPFTSDCLVFCCDNRGLVFSVLQKLLTETLFFYHVHVVLACPMLKWQNMTFK